jgi:hypothetical protein
MHGCIDPSRVHPVLIIKTLAFKWIDYGPIHDEGKMLEVDCWVTDKVINVGIDSWSTTRWTTSASSTPTCGTTHGGATTVVGHPIGAYAPPTAAAL